MRTDTNLTEPLLPKNEEASLLGEGEEAPLLGEGEEEEGYGSTGESVTMEGTLTVTAVVPPIELNDWLKKLWEDFQIAGLCGIDGINGGFGPSTEVLTFLFGLRDYVNPEQWVLPTTFAIPPLALLCSLKRTHSAINDDDGISSFIGVNIGIDFFTFFNFTLSLMADIASSILGPEAEDAPWSIAGPIIGLAFLLSVISTYVSREKHLGRLNKAGEVTFEACQFLQILSAGSTLVRLITGINPIHWSAFLTTTIPAFGFATIARASRDRYPILYKIGDDLLPMLAYLISQGSLLQDDAQSGFIIALFYILISVCAFGPPLFALRNGMVPEDHMAAILENPILVPGIRGAEMDTGIGVGTEEAGAEQSTLDSIFSLFCSRNRGTQSESETDTEGTGYLPI